MKLIKYLLPFVLCVAVSCNSDVKPEEEGKIEFDADQNLNPVIEGEGGTIQLEFTANNQWTCTVSSDAAEWITVRPTSGDAGDNTLYVNVSNNNTGSERSATIRLDCKKSNASVKLTQKYENEPYIIPVKTEYSLTYVKQTLQIEVKHNVDVEPYVSSTISWLKYTGNQGDIFTFELSENTDEDERVAAVMFMNDENRLSESVKVVQSGKDAPSPVVTTKGWYELPAMDDANGDGHCDSDENLYYASHSFKANNGQSWRNYTVCFGAKEHVPYWVAAPRHSCYTGSTGRSDAYGCDPNIPSTIQYNSKSTGAGCNKGHMLGSAERTHNSACNKQVFYYTNIAPQNGSTFNTGGGAWNNLEERVDTYVCADTLYEVVGAYFKQYTDAYGKTVQPKTIDFGGRSDTAYPTMFYYVLLRTKTGKTGKAIKNCDASELKCAAFVIRHTMEKGHNPCAKDMMSVSDLEKITGFTYFANVPQAPKSTMNPSDWGL